MSARKQKVLVRSLRAFLRSWRTVSPSLRRRFVVVWLISHRRKDACCELLIITSELSNVHLCPPSRQNLRTNMHLILNPIQWDFSANFSEITKIYFAIYLLDGLLTHHVTSVSFTKLNSFIQAILHLKIHPARLFRDLKTKPLILNETGFPYFHGGNYRTANSAICRLHLLSKMLLNDFPLVSNVAFEMPLWLTNEKSSKSFCGIWIFAGAFYCFCKKMLN